MSKLNVKTYSNNIRFTVTAKCPEDEDCAKLSELILNETDIGEEIKKKVQQAQEGFIKDLWTGRPGIVWGDRLDMPKKEYTWKEWYAWRPVKTKEGKIAFGKKIWKNKDKEYSSGFYAFSDIFYPERGNKLETFDTLGDLLLKRYMLDFIANMQTLSGPITRLTNVKTNK